MHDDLVESPYMQYTVKCKEPNLLHGVVHVDGTSRVQTVKKVIIENKQGGNYSEYAYDVKGATKDNIVYPSYDPSIFEVKFPDTDIEGRVTNI